MFASAIMRTNTPGKGHIQEALHFFFNLNNDSFQISAYACGDVWQQRGIGNNVQGPVSVMQRWDVWSKRQKVRMLSEKSSGFWFAGFLNEGYTQSYGRLADQSGFTQAAIFLRLNAKKKTGKDGKGVPLSLTDRQMSRRQNTCQILLDIQNWKTFLHWTVNVGEN